MRKEHRSRRWRAPVPRTAHSAAACLGSKPRPCSHAGAEGAGGGWGGVGGSSAWGGQGHVLYLTASLGAAYLGLRGCVFKRQLRLPAQVKAELGMTACRDLLRAGFMRFS